MINWQRGDSLAFTVYNNTPGKTNECLGTAILTELDGDFDGELLLTDGTVRKGVVYLKVRVRVPADQTTSELESVVVATGEPQLDGLVTERTESSHGGSLAVEPVSGFAFIPELLYIADIPLYEGELEDSAPGMDLDLQPARCQIDFELNEMCLQSLN